MEAPSADNKLFNRLIRRQRDSIPIAGDRLRVNGELVTTITEVLTAWTGHFAALTTPQEPEENDPAYDKLVAEDLIVIELLDEDHPTAFNVISESEVIMAMRKLKLDKRRTYTGSRQSTSNMQAQEPSHRSLRL